MKIKVVFYVMFFITLIATQALCLEDTPANRQSQTERYLKAVPPRELFFDMADKLATQIPEEGRAEFKAAMTRNLDINALIDAMSKAMVKHFTADELSSLADFYGSPVGKSAMKKFGLYMAEIMPTLQIELKKAIEKTSEEFKVSE